MTKNGIVPQLETAAKSDDGDNRKRVNVGDFVINSRSDRKGSSGLSEFEGSVSLINTVLLPINIDGRFAHHLLRSTGFQEEYYRFGKGIVADLWSTNYGELKNILLPLPPVAEQQQIAKFIDHETAKIDELIAKQQRLILLLEVKRRSEIDRAVTRGIEVNPRLKPSGLEWLGSIPDTWKIARLKFLAEIQTGIAKGKDYGERSTVSVPYLRVANVQDGYLDLETVESIVLPAEELDRYLLQVGDVLMNEGGDNDKLGRGHVWRGEVSPCVHQNHVFAVRPKKVSPEWLNTYTSSRFAQFYFQSKAKQSTNLASISSTNLMDLPVVVPPSEEQGRVLEWLARELATIDKLIEKARRSCSLMREHRSALISAAVTGKIDVREMVA